MKRIRLFRYTSFLVQLLLLSAVLGVRPLASEKDLADLGTIRRDSFGVPHILAETEEALAFGMGYAQAEDHAVEIARRLVTARGEQAKHLGTGIESDFRMKRYGNHEVARTRFGDLSPLFQEMMNAYAAGFNRYVAKHRSELPNWIPEFDGVDVLAHGRSEVMRFAFNERMIRSLQMKYPDTSAPRSDKAEAPSEDAEAVAYAGSNMWALSGKLTTSGKPILMGNPHQSWAALYWEAHITVPGKVNFYGSTFIGRPVLTTGFNEHLGWSHTVNYPDLADIFVLDRDPEDPRRYIFNGQQLPFTRKEIAVEVKQSDGKIEEQRRIYLYSHIGPVVHTTPDKAFALRSSILNEFRYYEQWYEMSKSKGLAEFTAALRLNRIPMFNIVYADVDGNILYVWNGMVPKRLDDGIDYREEIPGSTDKYVWKELHRLEELPQLLNPPGGYVQNCNDAPWYTSLRDPLDPKKYPSYIEPGRQLGLRTQMSLRMIEAHGRKFSLEDVKRMKYDERMLLAERVKPDLIKALRGVKQPSADLKQGLSIITAWNNEVSAESRGGVLFKRFWDSYVGASKQPFAQPWDPKSPARTPSGIAEPEIAVKVFEDAVRWTREKYGSANVAWGEVHRLRLGELDLPVGGESGLYGLFRVMGFGDAPDGKRVIGSVEKGKPFVGGGDGWVFAVEFSRPVVAYSILPYGNTSDLRSPASTAQAKLFASGKYKKVWFTEEEIKSNLDRAYRPR